jgi:hypothetical protein
VAVERLPGGGGQVVGACAGGLQGAEQRQGALAHGLLDQWRLAQARGGKHLVQAGGVGGQAALAAGPA